MRHNTFILNKSKTSLNSGFGLIELIVSISIVVLVTSIIMVRHTSYNGAVLLRSEAYKVALQVREVQLSAVSVVGDAGDFRNVFGLYFNTSVTPNYYYTFRDSDGDFYYDSGEEVGKRNNIDLRFELDEIRLMNGATTVSTETDLAVTFERPNFDARFFTSSAVEALSPVSVAEIDVRVKGTTGTTTGEVRTVEVSRTGQVTVK